jgi:hypothetical protein
VRLFVRGLLLESGGKTAALQMRRTSRQNAPHFALAGFGFGLLGGLGGLGGYGLIDF